jgi:Tol biopolymer transport system component
MNARKLIGLLLTLAVATPAFAQGPPRGGRGGQDEKPLPLPAARHANFTATEGTWMSLDVSPDGQTIVFDLLGDLYTMPFAGGKAKQITKGLQFDSQPRFSPDGESIVFISDRSGGDNVWTMRLDFTDTTQVTRGNSSIYLSPDWMPDGQHIVVSRSGGLGQTAKLILLNVDRRSPMPVIRQPANRKTIGAAPSPDGRYIWYAGRTGDWMYNAIFPQYQLYRYDHETGNSTRFTGRYGSGFRPAVSPDGHWLVYGTRFDTQTGLRIRDLTNGDERWLAYPVQRDELESRAPLDVLPGYAFTPDSREVVAAWGGKIWRVPLDGTDPIEVPFEAEVKLDVGPEVKFSYKVDTSDTVTARQIRHPVPSPDGRRIVFTAFDRLWVQDLPKGEPQRLTQAEGHGEFHAVWSPDGEWIAWASWSDSIGGHVWKTRSNGRGQPQQLTSVAALYYNLAWSPDGTRIVASRGAARELKKAPDVFFGPIGGEFVWVPAAGGAVTVIAPTGGRDVAHFNMHEPDRIYAYSFSQGLVSFRWDGTDVKRHVMVRGEPARMGGNPLEDELRAAPRRVFPVQTSDWLDTDQAEPGAPPPPASLVMISPQGGRAVAQVGMQLYTVDLPPLKDPTPTVTVANPAAAPVTVRRLTEFGGEFPAWSTDGERVYWAIGNAMFTYNLAFVEFEEDSTEEATHQAALRALRAKELVDSLKAVRKSVDSLKAANEVVPDSLQQRLQRMIADSVQVRADSLLLAVTQMQARARAIEARADSVREGLLDEVLPDTVYKPTEVRIAVKMPRDIPRGTVVLQGGRVLTMKEHEIIENAVVVITDDSIVAVGPPDSVEIPEGARVIDVSGTTLIPGFVDTHYHAQWLVPEIHTEQVWQYLTNLAFGVTTTRDPQTATTDILAYTDRVETGAMLGPRIYSTGPGVFLSANISNAKEAKQVLTRYAKYYDTKTLKMYMSGNRQQRQWIIQAAKELEIMPTTEGGLDFKLELTHALDGYPRRTVRRCWSRTADRSARTTTTRTRRCTTTRS